MFHNFLFLSFIELWTPKSNKLRKCCYIRINTLCNNSFPSSFLLRSFISIIISEIRFNEHYSFGRARMREEQDIKKFVCFMTRIRNFFFSTAAFLFEATKGRNESNFQIMLLILIHVEMSFTF